MIGTVQRFLNEENPFALNIKYEICVASIGIPIIYKYTKEKNLIVLKTPKSTSGGAVVRAARWRSG